MIASVVASVFDPLYQALGTILAAFYAVVPSYGAAIAMLTLTVRAALIPLTAKQVRSQQAMQRLGPEMKRIQAKYKGDRQRLNEEMMKFYKEHNFNTLSGCLPLILQAPLFIVLYRIIHDLTPPGGAPPRHIPTSSELYRSLVEAGGRMTSWGMDLGQKTTDVSGFGAALPYYLLLGVVIATGYYQQRQMTARLPQGASNPQMQMMGKIFPVMLGLISISVPAGVVVYFATSNFWQIGQQAITFRLQGPIEPLGGTTKKGGREPEEKPAAKRSSKPTGRVTEKKGGSGARSSGSSRSDSQRTQKGGKRPPASPRPRGLPGSGGKAKGSRVTPKGTKGTSGGSGRGR
jgi:YidC/Oxa1 family membrane protein insertase